MKHVLEKKSIN